MDAVTQKTMSIFEKLSESSKNTVLNFVEFLANKKDDAEKIDTMYFEKEDHDDCIYILNPI